MKIAVINFSGNVGKSTVAANLLAPRLPGARLFSIESINSDAEQDGVVVEKLQGKQYHRLMSELFLEDDAIVDVGASNIGDFLDFMAKYEKSHEYFDLYVVPVVSERKQQIDTINTIETLSEIGIPSDKIRLVFNKVDDTDEESLRDAFAPIFGQHRSNPNFVLNSAAAIESNEGFDLIKGHGMTLSELAADDTDFKANAKATKDPAERTRWVSLAMTQMLARTIQKNLDTVFEALVQPVQCPA